MKKTIKHSMEDMAELIALVPNTPATQFEENVAHEVQTEEHMKEVFSSFPHLLANAALLREVARLTVAIRTDYQVSIEAHLKIGFALLDVRDKLDQQEALDVYLTAGVLPFSKGHASKIMTVAREYRAGRFERALGRSLEPRDMPPMSVAYELHALTDPQLRSAAQEGLISPNASRKAVIEFKSKVKMAAFDAFDIRRAKLAAELTRLEERKGRLTAEIRKIEIRIAEVEADLKQPMLQAAE